MEKEDEQLNESSSSSATTFVVDPSRPFYYRWLSLISIAVLYNLLIIIGRSVFWELQNACPTAWFTIDYASDALYLLDMLVNSRTGESNFFSKTHTHVP